ncbi:hypothetical protein HZH66_007961 [Vespula vulgaris]|uniref:Uncharacterized protein n=1 Tax=Vespula vulgaris TaxID=7454 RepID=A0A834N3C7_VESVU|nr:hypothetical protein HZH66_007961 [Vespula vulgaris]
MRLDLAAAVNDTGHSPAPFLGHSMAFRNAKTLTAEHSRHYKRMNEGQGARWGVPAPCCEPNNYVTPWNTPRAQQETEPEVHILIYNPISERSNVNTGQIFGNKIEIRSIDRFQSLS